MDAVCCSAALNHFQDPRQALIELRGCLRPGGQLFLTVPDRFPPTELSNDYRRYSQDQILDLLKQGGWHIESCRAIGGRYWLTSRLALERLFTNGNPEARHQPGAGTTENSRPTGASLSQTFRSWLKLSVFVSRSAWLGMALPWVATFWIVGPNPTVTLGWAVHARKRPL